MTTPLSVAPISPARQRGTTSMPRKPNKPATEMPEAATDYLNTPEVSGGELPLAAPNSGARRPVRWVHEITGGEPPPEAAEAATDYITGLRQLVILATIHEDNLDGGRCRIIPPSSISSQRSLSECITPM